MCASAYLSLYIMREKGRGLLPIPSKPYGFRGRQAPCLLTYLGLFECVCACICVICVCGGSKSWSGSVVEGRVGSFPAARVFPRHCQKRLAITFNAFHT